jgi:hypothetical protein
MTLELAIKSFGGALPSINIGDKVLLLSQEACLHEITTGEFKCLSGRPQAKVLLVQIITITPEIVRYKPLLEFGSDTPNTTGVAPSSGNQTSELNLLRFRDQAEKSFSERWEEDRGFWRRFALD